jgi:hypothetical protein
MSFLSLNSATVNAGEEKRGRKLGDARIRVSVD